MPAYRDHLPQLDTSVFLTDGGIETTLVFDEGIDLPDFAAFPLLDDAAGVAALRRYYEAYAAIAARDSVGIVLETATWRANLDWGARQGYDTDAIVRINEAAVALLLDIRAAHETASSPIVVSGCIGPRGDGYRPEAFMTAAEARAYHAVQARAFAATDADLVTAITMTYPDEAIGIAEAARDAGMPVVISFTVETDGRLPTGATLGEAVAAVDDATNAYPAYYMVNCAHPTHFADVLGASGPWTGRLGGIRANASALSHAELDEATELDAGNPAELAEQYGQLRALAPSIVVLGGCCGTSAVHIDAISAASTTPSAVG